MNYLLFLACITAFSLPAGCRQPDNAMPLQLTATQKLIQKKRSLSGVSIRTDKATTYGLTRAQWQGLGIDLDNLTFRPDGRYASSSSASGTYRLKQAETVLELPNEPYSPFIFYELSVSEFAFSGRSPAVAVNPQKPTPDQSEQILASYGLRGLALFKEVDLSQVKTIQLLFTYTGL